MPDGAAGTIKIADLRALVTEKPVAYTTIHFDTGL
jgi:hypothetical protein